GSKIFSGTDSNATHTFSKSGTYTVKLEIDGSSGCSDSNSASIVVSDIPKPDFSVPDGCLGSQISFTNNTSPSTGISWYWNFGDLSAISTLQNPKHSYTKTGAFSVKLGAANSGGCSDTIVKTVNIYPNPNAAWTATTHNFTA